MTDGKLTIEEAPKMGNIIFSLNDGEPFVEMRANGDFLVKGKLVVTDMAVYDAVKEYFELANAQMKQSMKCQGCKCQD